MSYTKESILELLTKNIVTVTFTKVDGTERVMQCTLLPEYLPVAQGEKLKETTAQNISVWDLNAKGWRSFRVPSVKSVVIV